MKAVHTLFAGLLAITVLAACNSNASEEKAELVTGLPASLTPADSSRPVISNQAATAGINPAHGAPGHRCEIAVGAPLSSAPAVALKQPLQSAPIQMQQPVPPSPVKQANPAGTAAAIRSGNTAPNPAHGQPGHRCDIAVGAPLNSAPTQNQQPVQTAPLQIAQPAPVTPLKQAGSGGNAKLNPAHGQPGHDCAIPVGQPLKQ